MLFIEYLTHLESIGQPELTVKAYKSDLTMFEAWYILTNTTLPEIRTVTPMDVRDYRNDMVSRNLSPATINRRLCAIRVAYNWYVANRIVDINPGNGVRGLTEKTTPPRWLDHKQVNAFLRQLERDYQTANTQNRREIALRMGVICNLILNSGLRVGELCGLRLHNIDLSSRTATLTIIGKGSKERVIPLNRIAVKQLELWLLDHTPQNRNDPIFTRVSPRGIEKHLTGVSNRAGLGFVVTPHSLRHTFAHNLINSGVTLDVVATILGHDRLDTTRLYTKPGELDLARAVDKIAP